MQAKVLELLGNALYMCRMFREIILFQHVQELLTEKGLISL
jgi:hypothetical protein